MHGAATQAMSFIVEERQRSLSRRLSQMPARPPPRPEGLRQQNAHVIHAQTLRRTQ
jgi:hypothetical protein